MIGIEEIPVSSIGEFWERHIAYLIGDGIITDEEDIEYFSGDEYRSVIEQHMLRDNDRHHLVWFVRDGERIGAASYCTYSGEGGKCFILDFWVFPEYRGDGTGHRCFEALERYTREDGTLYYELNSEKEGSVRFWRSLGFSKNGADEYGMPLYIRR
ncbi:MAG: GNAT family N-acetyltransferase [Oscillospiraceae bacterium]|nr:GNAT family N-acetyltransferase [Oscillospiraceae bacterium]